MSKIQTWKQITTQRVRHIAIYTLYSICQRYKLESKLQLCNHKCLVVLTVFNMSKIQTWKQITTHTPSSIIRNYCIQYVKDTNLKANYNVHWDLPCKTSTVFNMSKIQTWKQITTHLLTVLFLFHCIQYVKDTNLKANYNAKNKITINCDTVFNMSKIQTWKQITTTMLS